MNLFRSWLSQLSASTSVLDLGCGAGSFDYGACGQPPIPRIYGVDCNHAVLTGSRMLVACADGARLPFSSNSFDLVVCNHSLEHFLDADVVIQEVRRVLKPEGRLFVTVPEAASFSDRLYRLMLAGGGHSKDLRLTGSCN